MKSRSISRGRRLTSEEAEHYDQIRRRIEAEKPEILDRSEHRRQEAQEVCAQFRSAREQAGLSLTDLNQRSGIDRAALSKLENGVRGNPTLDTMIRFADALGLKLVVRLETERR